MNKGITNISYNSLSLPQVVTFSNGNTITYLYTADGRKLRTVHKIGTTTTTTDYCGNVIYENGTQKLLLTEEGYINLNSPTTYYYYLKDHQGNNRVVLSSSGTVLETNHYYPFGGVFSTSTNVQQYKYNGKELDTANGLNWYDYGARHYDAALGRWHVVDPLAEKMYGWSPYGYCRNNPVIRKDVGGKWDVTVHAFSERSVYGFAYLDVTDKSGNIVYRTMVRVEGSNSAENGFNKRDRTKTYADTPTGTYKIRGWSNRLSKLNRAAYGPNDILELDYIEGEAAGKRSGIHLHGGRQEDKGGKEKGAKLQVTQGCMRIYDEDIAEMKLITDLLEQSDPNEKGNYLYVTNDLQQMEDGSYHYQQKNDKIFNLWKTLAELLMQNPNIVISFE